MVCKAEAATIFCRNQWKVCDKDGNVRAKIATGEFTIFQTWAVLKLKLISILSVVIIKITIIVVDEDDEEGFSLLHGAQTFDIERIDK